MASAGPSQRRPVVGEVISEFADGGGTFVRSKLDDHVLEIEKRKIERDQKGKAEVLEKALAAREGKGGEELKEEDVLVIMSELDIPRKEATQALQASKGDLEKALSDLISPPDAHIGWKTRI